MDRRIQQTDRREEVKDQAFHLSPERWAQLYEGEMRAALGLEGAEGRDRPVTNVESLDQWYASAVVHGEKHTANGGAMPGGAGEYWQDWSPWQ